MKRVLIVSSLALGTALSAQAVPLSIVNNIPGAYASISGMAGTTAITVTDDSEHNINMNFGNIAFPGGNWRIGNNGCVVSNSTTGEIGFTNAAIAAGSLPTLVGTAGNAPAVAVLLPLWDDHFPSGTVSPTGILWRNDPDVTTIEWINEDHFSATGAGTITFQLKVYANGTGPGGALAQYIYPDTNYAAGSALNNAGSATIGYIGVAALGHNNVQWSSNVAQPSDPGNPDGMVTLSLVPEPASLVLLALGGLLAFRRR